MAPCEHAMLLCPHWYLPESILLHLEKSVLASEAGKEQKCMPVTSYCVKVELFARLSVTAV